MEHKWLKRFNRSCLQNHRALVKFNIVDVLIAVWITYMYAIFEVQPSVQLRTVYFIVYKFYIIKKHLFSHRHNKEKTSILVNTSVQKK